MLWTDSAKEVRVSLEEGSYGCHIDLAGLIGRANSRSRRKLVRLIEERQEDLIYEMCGPRYSRGYVYRRGGSYTKRLVTSLGEIRFRVERVIRRIDDKVRSPILEALDVKRRKYSRDMRMKCVEFASKMSYGDASMEFEKATGVHVSKRTIHSFVQQIAPRLLELNRTAAKAGIVIALAPSATCWSTCENRGIRNPETLRTEENKAQTQSISPQSKIFYSFLGFRAYVKAMIALQRG